MAVKKAKSGRERRRSARVDAQLTMQVHGTHDGGETKVVTETRNISMTGVYAHSSHYLPPLSKVVVMLVLPRIPRVTTRHQPIRCEAIVVRCEMSPDKRRQNPYDLACMFTGLDAERRDMLEAYVTFQNLRALRDAVLPGPLARVPVVRRASSTTKKKAVTRTSSVKKAAKKAVKKSTTSTKPAKGAKATRSRTTTGTGSRTRRTSR